MTGRRGPWCSHCAHDYTGEVFSAEQGCPYCGEFAPRIDRRPFVEFSKTQIEKWGMPGDEYGCPTRWFFKYVLRRQEPKSPELEFGISAHAIAEKWMRHGTMPQVNSLAPKSTETKAALSLLGGIPHMPPPSLHGLRVESEFHYGFEGVRYMGFKDVWAPLGPVTGQVPDRLQFEKSVIGDWKFVSRKSFDAFTPSPDVLAISLQGTLEGFDDVRRGSQETWLNWVFMPRGERIGKPVRAIITPETSVSRMREINSVAKRMLDVLTLPGANVRDMETNPRACNAYNRPCPFSSECHVSKDQQIFAAAIKIGESIMQGFPGVPNGQPSALGALVAGLTPAQPAAPAAPPAEPHPESVWKIVWQGQQYDVPYKKIAELQKGGMQMQILGPVAPQQAPALPTPPTPVAPAPGTPVAASVVPSPAAAAPTLPTVPAPTTPTPKTTRKDRKAAAIAPGSTDTDGDEIVDAFNHALEALHVPLRIVRM